MADKKHNTEKGEDEWGEALHEKPEAVVPYPKVSVIIPTYNSSQLIAYTLESILLQKYPDYEVIVVDAGSTDRTLEVAQGYFNPHIRVCTVAAYNTYEMLNKGISMAKGLYINCLFPGDYYLHPHVLQFIMDVGIEYDFPHLLYSASLLRKDEDIKLLYRPLSLELLKQGKQPTSLQACYFHVETFRVIGKCNISYLIRGGFDLLCRFILYTNLRVISNKRVLSDSMSMHQTPKKTLQHFTETFHIINLYFGWFQAIKWFFIQRDISRLFSLCLRTIKAGFLGESR